MCGGGEAVRGEGGAVRGATGVLRDSFWSETLGRYVCGARADGEREGMAFGPTDLLLSVIARQRSTGPSIARLTP